MKKCHCYGFFGEAVSSIPSCGNEEHCLTEDSQTVAQQIRVPSKFFMALSDGSAEVHWNVSFIVVI